MVNFPERGFQPERLLEARMARGYSQLELARHLDVKRQSLSAYEKGLSQPKLELIEKASLILGFAFDFFFVPTEKIDLDVIHFRRNKTAREKAYAALQVRLEWMARFFNFLQEYIDFTPLDSLRKENETYDDGELEEIVVEARRAWGLGLGPISNMAALLETHGFLLAKFDVDLEKVDACSTTVVTQEGTRHFICLASRRSQIEKSAARMRNDLAHEYGHFVLHSAFNKDYIQQNHDQVEHEAKYFASAVLLPQDSFVREARFLTNVEDFLRLKERWKVSIQSMVYRCRQLGVISEYTYKYLQRQISAKGWRKQEPGDDINEFPLEKTRTLGDALRLIVDNGITTPLKIQETLGIPAEELAMMCEVDPGYFLPRPLSGKVIQLRHRI